MTLEEIRVAVLEVGNEAFASGQCDQFVSAIKTVLQYRATIIENCHINRALRSSTAWVARVTCERRIGQLLIEMKRLGFVIETQPPGYMVGTRPPGTVTLEQLDISREQSRTWQKLAKMSTEEWEACLQEPHRENITGAKRPRHYLDAAPPIMKIADITIGVRHRKDMGDIQKLANNIAEIGLLHPPVVTPDGELIAGERRLKALGLSGRTETPVTVVDIDEIVRGEYAENTERKDFTWSEAVAIKRALEPLEKAAAKERQTRKPISAGKLPEQNKGRARDKVARATGKKAKTLAKAEEVVAAAEAEPEKFGHLVEEMDESGKVDFAFRQVKNAQARAAYDKRAEQGGRVADLNALVTSGKKFAVILADPAWSFEVYSDKGKERSAERHYDCMALDDIKALPVQALAADDCVLLLWCVNPELQAALDVIKAWGFEYKTVGFNWIKQNRSGEGLFTGLGYWTRANSEPCLLATRGNPQRLDMGVHQVVMAPVGEHSVKPVEVHERIERLLAGPYLEMFARAERPGWVSWGNELIQMMAAAE